MTKLKVTESKYKSLSSSWLNAYAFNNGTFDIDISITVDIDTFLDIHDYTQNEIHSGKSGSHFIWVYGLHGHVTAFLED